MANTIILDDYQSNKKHYIIFVDTDYEIIRKAWFDKKAFMPEIRKLITYNDCYMWNDLSASQWKMLCAIKAHEVSMLSTKDQQDETNPKVMVFHFFLKGFIHFLEYNIGCCVDSVRIQRTDHTTVNFLVSFSDCVGVEHPEYKKPELVVLDGGE